MANYHLFYDSISPTSESLGKQPGNLEIMLGNSYHKTSLENTVLCLELKQWVNKFVEKLLYVNICISKIYIQSFSKFLDQNLY